MGAAQRSDGRDLEVQVVHASPGRLRLRVPRDALEGEALREAERALGELVGVHEVRKNRAARSVLVRYDGDAVDLPGMLAAVAQAGMNVTPIDGADASPDPAAAGDSIVAVLRRADRRVGELTGGRTDLRTLVPVAFAVLGTRQILAGQFGAVPGYVLLWYAFDAFMKLRKPKAGGDRPED